MRNKSHLTIPPFLLNFLYILDNTYFILPKFASYFHPVIFIGYWGCAPIVPDSTSEKLGTDRHRGRIGRQGVKVVGDKSGDKLISTSP